MKVLRNSERLKLKISLGTHRRLIPAHNEGRPPSYYIIAGFVFSAVSVPYLRSEVSFPVVLTPSSLLSSLNHCMSMVSDLPVFTLYTPHFLRVFTFLAMEMWNSSMPFLWMWNDVFSILDSFDLILKHTVREFLFLVNRSVQCVKFPCFWFCMQYGKEYGYEAPVKLLDKLLYEMPQSSDEQVVVVSQVLPHQNNDRVSNIFSKKIVSFFG